MDSIEQTLLTKNLLTVALSNAKDTERQYDKIGKIIGIDVGSYDSNQLNHRYNVLKVLSGAAKRTLKGIYNEYEDEIEDCLYNLIDATDIDGITKFFNDIFNCINKETTNKDELENIVQSFIKEHLSEDEVLYLSEDDV